MESKPVGKLPWQPQSEIRGNLAIGNLRENLLRFLGNERGVHAETLLTAMGALAGFAGQNAALIRAAAATSAEGYVPQYSVVLIGTKPGERYLAGEWINAHLFNEAGSVFPLWGFIAAAATESGAAREELADIRDIARHVASSLGGADYGKLRAPAGHQPALQPNELLRKLWPRVCEILRLPLPEPIRTNELPLEEIHWPIIVSMVASQFIKLTKDVLHPRISFALAMESAVISSKVDPELVAPGNWDFHATAGSLAVKRRSSPPAA